jgi:glutathione S-transferase
MIINLLLIGRFETYFAHVDNVYSHRSTQKYKRKPFVSHYWDCRLKGRPPGTPKSDDPNKKKRKRTARERDLCDVKIKITEYFPGAMLRPDFVPDGGQDGGHAAGFFSTEQSNPLANQQFHILAPDQAVPSNHPGANGARYYTIQRVNGNGGNGKADGVAGPHKHTLADSDKVKKNSIQRFLIQKEKEDKKTQVGFLFRRLSGWRENSSWFGVPFLPTSRKRLNQPFLVEFLFLLILYPCSISSAFH